MHEWMPADAGIVVSTPALAALPLAAFTACSLPSGEFSRRLIRFTQARHLRPRGAHLMRTILALLGLLLCATVSAQSGVISGQGGAAQCYVLIDSVSGTPACVHRASVACVAGSVGYVGGIASAAPLTYPLAIQLYQRPSQVPSGVLTFGELPSVAGQPVTVALNGAVSTWVLSAPMWGQTCTPAYASPPPVDPHALARYCRQYPSVPACRG